jgi:uncharacterized FlaG/YvyC family protein
MARSPFSGTYQPNARPTVVTAPDALVYINGEAEVIGCPQCNRFFDFNKYITSVQVDLSIDSVPGSASLSLSVPRHTIDDFYFDGNPVITPMMEVEIFAKGYYLVEGLPQYYPIFWGLVTEVSDDYSSGGHTVSIHCADILKWWELCKMNINPAFTAPKGQQGSSIFGNVYFGMNPYDVIWSLALQSFGDVLVGTGSLVSLIKEQSQRPTFDAALSDLMLYWEQRFSRVRSNLLLYGTNGVAVRGDSLNQEYSRVGNTGTAKKPSHFASAAVRNANGGVDGGQVVFAPDAPEVVAFRTQFQQAGQINLWQTEYQTKLELAHAAKEAAGFEFYMDVDGTIVFKPPFYNLDILANKPVSWIQDIDIIEWGLSESEAEVVTQVVMQGSMYGSTDYGLGEETTPFTSVTDYHLLRKYGWRSQNYNSEFLGDPQLMFYHGMDVMDRLNSRRHRGTVTIPLRPELRLGFPIYLAPKDQMWYVAGISHNIAFGGRASTTLTLTAKRSKFIAPKGIGTLTLNEKKGTLPTPNQISANVKLSFPYTSKQLAKGGHFTLKVGGAATLPPTRAQIEAPAGSDNPYDPLILRHPKTGRIVGYPNVVMAYTRPFAPANEDIKAAAGETNKPNKQASKASAGKAKAVQAQGEQELARLKTSIAEKLKENHTTNRYQYGLNSAGVYIYAHDNSMNGAGVIGEILTLPTANVTIDPKNTAENVALAGKTSMIRPVSDERGFEVIGHFRYGRRVSLRDGRLVLTGNVNDKTNIDLQLALSGGLFETLAAQSQGLTTIQSAYPNPATSLATLSPEDQQTAAIINPETKAIKFTDVGDNFVDTAPLGSPAQKGTAVSVEAGQLSRALTLAELTIKEAYSQKQGEDDCPCVIGRADLAFINVGYQVKTINPSSPDNTRLFNNPAAGASTGPINVGADSALARNIGELKALLAQYTKQKDESINEAISGRKTNSKATNAADQKVTDAQKRIDDVQKRLDEAQKKLDNINASSASGTGGPAVISKELQARVETFLTDLYMKLDAPHQQFEHAIRGDLRPGGAGPNAGSADFEPPEPSNFAPPFSAPGRFEIGDPNAIAGQASSAVNDLSKTWDDFGAKLKNNAVKAGLQGEIKKNTGDVARLQAQRAKLQASVDTHSAVIPSPTSRIASLDADIQRLKQEIANDQAKLNTLK